MIEINLLPEELRKSRHSASKIDADGINPGKTPLLKIALAAAGIIIIIQIAVFVAGIIYSANFSSLEKNYKQILPVKQETERLRAEISKMGKKVSAIDELMVKRFSWAKKLNDLSDSTTPGIWLTQLEYEEKLTDKTRTAVVKSGMTGINRKGAGSEKTVTEKVVESRLIISGAASSMGEEGTALIGRFIQNLKDSKPFYSDFSDIELGAIKREQMSGQEIMTFKIICLFKTR